MHFLSSLFLVFMIGSAYGATVTTIQTFRGMTNGYLWTQSSLLTNAYGNTRWSHANNQPSTNTFRIVSGEDLAFSEPLTAGGVTISSTGTNWLRGDHDTTNGTEQVWFVPDVHYPGWPTNKMMVLRAFFRTTSSNRTESLVNYDLAHIEGIWTVFQMHNYGDSHLTAMVHTGGGVGGSSLNGSEFNLERGKIYYVTLLLDNVNKISRLRFYDPANSYSVVGSSEVNFVPTTGYGWWLKLQVNYLGHGAGYSEWAGVAVDYGPSVSDALVLSAAPAQPEPMLRVEKLYVGSLVLE